MKGKQSPGAGVFVVEDDPGMSMLYRELLASIGLPAECFASGDDFLSKWSPAWQGIVVLDLLMPGTGGIDVLRRLRELDSRLPVIIVTAHGKVRSSVEAMKLGAVDFLEKPFSNAEFITAIQAMMLQFSQAAAIRALQTEAERALAALSAREHEVGRLIARGMTSREIGQLLSISPRTVDVHRAHVIEKLNCASSVELAAFFSRVSPEEGNASKS